MFSSRILHLVVMSPLAIPDCDIFSDVPYFDDLDSSEESDQVLQCILNFACLNIM